MTCTYLHEAKQSTGNTLGYFRALFSASIFVVAVHPDADM